MNKSAVQTHIIRPEHLNHSKHLFGGQMLSWADEVAYLGATLRFPGCAFVTKALEATDFKTPACEGHIVQITGTVIERGNTSCKVLVEALNITTHHVVFSTHFIMVNVVDGNKQPIPADADKP